MLRNAAVFFKEFILHPRQLGSAFSSSGFLKRRIVRIADLANACVVVELGPGNGGTTRAILDAMNSDAKLLSIELSQNLYELNSQIDDPRYLAHRGDARDLVEILAEYRLPQPTIVISGIPFSTIDADVGTRIIQTIHQQLTPGGKFVAYQVSSRVDQLNGCFNEDQRSVEWEWLSIPPLRVWCWTKA